MNKALKVIILLMTVITFSPAQVLAQTRERAEISDKYKWNLEDLYSSVEAWNTAKRELVAKFDQVSGYKGKLANSASELLACLEFNSGVSKDFGRLYSYANMKSDEDVGNSKYLAMKQEIQQLSTDYSSKAAFIRPEIAEMDKDKIDEFIEQDRGLKIYKMPLYDIQRTKAHTLSDKEEKILAEASLLAGGPSSIFSVFSNAELPYPEITLSDGTTAKLTKAGYAQHRASPNREDRETVFQAFWDTFTKFKGTFGTQLYANVKKDMFYARTRGYDSSLHSSLDENNIPTEVYLALIENVSNNLDSFHRYLNLKKRMLGVETLKYSDIYAPVVKGLDLKYTFDEAKKLAVDSVKPLGSSYGRVVEKAFKDRWIDVYPTPGKRSGGYCNGSAYDVHPYILLNYNGQYDDVSTLAHELGHAMHSYYSNKNQPYPTADYSIFVAEVASTFNEALLIHKMLEEIKDDDTRLSLLMNYLDGIKGTVFRQTQFAEFELRIHEKAERGEPLTGDVLSELYGEILKKYYGHDKGVCHIDDLYAIEWAYIPHFYYNFYVYQYSTSFTASTALAEKVLDREKGAVGKFVEFISSGGSDYPIDLLKKAGVDMTSAEPFNKTMEAMNRTMDEIEAILDKKGK
ncbi:MAG: oligoendopeptidase F [Planctomycetes bacterium]|nr:oligoendopeptidase F [Planctomycetota bacterium]MBL7145592.1 oligoendopeptidase F [Phycisphaerae bacterium]